MKRSSIYWRRVTAEAEINGRWVMAVAAAEDGPAGTLVCDPAPGEPDDLTFTASNGKRYWDTDEGCHWTPSGD